MGIVSLAVESRAELSWPMIPPGQKTVFPLVKGLSFLWGIPNNLNDTLIQQFIKSFEITRLGVGVVQSAFYFEYSFDGWGCTLPPLKRAIAAVHS